MPDRATDIDSPVTDEVAGESDVRRDGIIGWIDALRASYIARRLALLPVMLVGMTLITFLLSRLVAGDPVVAMLGDRGSDNPEAYAAAERELGLDKPIWVQYFTYLGRLLTGDFGYSSFAGRPVSDMLAQAFPATVELAVAALAIAMITGVALGIITATRRGSLLDSIVGAWSLTSVAIPAFVFALIALQVFYLQLGWVAGSGQFAPMISRPPVVTGMVTVDSLLDGNWPAFWSALHHLAFPAAVLGILEGGFFARFTRDTLTRALQSDSIRTARGKGLRRGQIVWGHALREALVPLIGLIGLYFGGLVTGAITVEMIAGWPGVGLMIFTASSRRDFVSLMGGVIVLSVSYIIVNLVVDLLYARADPRIRYR